MQLTRVVSRQPATYNYLVRDLVKPNENIGTTGLHDLLSTAPFKRPILPFEPDEMAYALSGLEPKKHSPPTSADPAHSTLPGMHPPKRQKVDASQVRV